MRRRATQADSSSMSTTHERRDDALAGMGAPVKLSA